MKYKLDWEKLQEDKLMEKRGVENYNYKKPLNTINSINCAYCGLKLKSNSERCELEHLEKCSKYLSAVKSGRLKNKHGLYKKFTSYKPLHYYSDNSDFPFCVVGKIISTPKFIGKVIKISSDEKKLVIVDDVGNEKHFLIEFLLKK